MNTKQFISMFLAGVMCFAFVGCQSMSAKPDATNAPVSYVNSVGESVSISLLSSGNSPTLTAKYDTHYTQANNSFAASFLSAMDPDWTGVYSPLSLQIAFQLLANGGDEQTRDLILDIVCKGMARDVANANTARLIAELNSQRGINLSSAVIVNNQYQLCMDYAETIADYYLASVGSVDFSDPQKAVSEINSWVSDNTNGLIDTIFDDLSSNTAAVLLSTLSLDLNWNKEFQALRGFSTFYGTAGEQSVSMISSNGDYSYGEFDCGQMLVVPYTNGDYCMAIMLPKKGITPSETVGQLMGRWNECTTSACSVKMPKINLNTSLDVMPMLEKLGLSVAMDGDFSEMMSGGGSVTDIIQGATLSVTETGTTAAAASGIAVEKGPFIPAYSIECNRPYAMVIYHAETNAVLFVSVVNNVG